MKSWLRLILFLFTLRKNPLTPSVLFVKIVRFSRTKSKLFNTLIYKNQIQLKYFNQPDIELRSAAFAAAVRRVCIGVGGGQDPDQGDVLDHVGLKNGGRNELKKMSKNLRRRMKFVNKNYDKNIKTVWKKCPRWNWIKLRTFIQNQSTKYRTSSNQYRVFSMPLCCKIAECPSEYSID